MIWIIKACCILPMQIGDAKVEGYVEFTRTWPVNRAVIIGADTSIWLGVTIPGLCIATLFAHLMFLIPDTTSHGPSFRLCY